MFSVAFPDDWCRVQQTLGQQLRCRRCIIYDISLVIILKHLKHQLTINSSSLGSRCLEPLDVQPERKCIRYDPISETVRVAAEQQKSTNIFICWANINKVFILNNLQVEVRDKYFQMF